MTERYGASLFEPERLRRIVGLLDAHGFQVHIHALGDRAVRESLDALESRAAVNGRRNARHHLAHVQFADAVDLPRFGELGVVANVTPYWAVLSGYVRDLTLPFVSPEAGASMYPFGEHPPERREARVRKRLDRLDSRSAAPARGRGHPAPARAGRRRSAPAVTSG